MAYIDGVIAERKRKLAAPSTIPNAAPTSDQKPAPQQPSYDPQKMAAPMQPAGGGGFNQASADNSAAAGRVTSPEALQPRVLGQRASASVLPLGPNSDPFLGQLERPAPSPSLFASTSPQQLLNSGNPYNGFFPTGEQQIINNLTPEQQSQAGRAPSPAAPPPSSAVLPVPTPTGSVQPTFEAVQGQGLQAQGVTNPDALKDPGTVALPGSVSTADLDRLRGNIDTREREGIDTTGRSGREAQVRARAEMGEAQRAARSEADARASRAGAGSAAGATGRYYRQIDKNVAEQFAIRAGQLSAQVAEREAQIRAKAQEERDRLEIVAKDQNLQAQEAEFRRLEAYQRMVAAQPPSALEKLGGFVAPAAASLLGGALGPIGGTLGRFGAESLAGWLRPEQSPGGAPPRQLRGDEGAYSGRLNLDILRELGIA
jgi:hypothetical protein